MAEHMTEALRVGDKQILYRYTVNYLLVKFSWLMFYLLCTPEVLTKSRQVLGCN